MHVTAAQHSVSAVRDLLDAEMDHARLPVRAVEVLLDNEEQVELAAILLPTTAEDAELDVVVAALERSPLVRSATWSVETTS